MAGNLQQQAIYFKSIPLLQRNVIASVHLEDMEDQRFCDAVLQQVRRGKYYYIAQSRSANNELTSGCEQCLAYRPYLDKKFFVFIDSDMRYMLQEKELDAAHYIGQTYTYSWENHYCEAVSLQKRFKREMQSHGLEVNFDFESFLLHLSEIVFIPLALLYYFLKHEQQPFTIRQLFKCIPTQCRREELQDNGKKLLEHIYDNFATLLAPYKDFDVSKEISELNALGIHSKNAYLHIRGHNLFDMIAYVGKLLCKKSQISFYNDVLVQEIPDSHYWEMQKIRQDFHQILY